MSSMPSYVNDMNKMLPKDIVAKQGVRVIDNSAGMLCDLLKKHATTADEIQEIRALIEDYNKSNSFGQLGHLNSQIDIKLLSVQDIIQKIRVRVKGRLVRPLHSQDIIYEICDYDESRGTIKLRLIFDQNGIMIQKTNTRENVRRSIRGTWLEKHYKILEQEEELDIRLKMLNSQEHKIFIKYQVMDVEGEPQCLPMQMTPEGLPMLDYEIKFDKNARKIGQIINKQYGPVEFEEQ